MDKNKDEQFVHLHVHSEFSTLDGINRVDTLPEYIKGLNQHSVALTDHGNVSGTYRFWKACKKAEVKPILGMEAYYTTQDRSVKDLDDLGEPYYHMVLLAQNNEGLHNLYKLSTFAYAEGMYRKPRIDDALLAEYSKGIAATSACLGSRTSQLILNNRTREAEKLITHHARIFQDKFFIEVQLHEDDEHRKVNSILVDMAKRLDLPLVLTGDCHYTHPQDKQLHEIALCMQTNDKMSNPKRFSFGEIDVHVANHNHMWNKASALGMPYDVISNTYHFANSIDSDSYFMDRMNRYPKFQGLPEELPPWEALERLAKNLLFEKFGGLPPQEYRDRIDHELKVIKRMGFYDYLLIVWEFLNGAREQGVWIGSGRGSAAGSLVAYALGITQIDPIEYGLIFERFLNGGRSATPLIFDNQLRADIEGTLEYHKSCHTHCNCD